MTQKTRLWFHEYEWSLSVPWALKDNGFRAPLLQSVANLGHPLLKRLALEHLVVDIEPLPASSIAELLASSPTHLLTLDEGFFECVHLEIVSTEENSTQTFLPNNALATATAPSKPPPKRLQPVLGKMIYGHTAGNDLSVWGSEYIRIVYALRHDKAIELLGRPDDRTAHYLWVEVCYQFGPYSWEPAHEPSGLLNSARLIPAISFETDCPRLTSLRADMRFDLAMDGLDDGLQPLHGFPGFAGIFKDLEVLSMQKGLGKLGKNIGQMLDGTDEEAHSGHNGHEQPQSAWNPIGQTVAEAPFASHEKPAPFEICADAWIAEKRVMIGEQPRAAPTYGVTPNAPDEMAVQDPITEHHPPQTLSLPVVAQWDNVHMWPGTRVLGKYVPELPSAPGAFYSFHCHWRWGYFLSDYWYLYFSLLAEIKLMLAASKLVVPLPGSDLLNVATELLGPLGYTAFMQHYFPMVDQQGSHAEYKGNDVGVPANMGGPLLDPALPHQDIKFAICKRTSARFDGAVHSDFATHFLGERAEPDHGPADISTGAELSFLISFAPRRGKDDNAKFGGTLFAHGIHFAHNLFEPLDPLVSLSVLSKGEATNNADVRQEWRR